ncbi:hypothetical protein DICVIV_08934 [Dictyocaulus viviparus]|uniref:Uncharacterized protein n=1 Tax=Dictyocaulus viviparus TaxID=29172 RepID=A0A0D8XRK7_DICVI|nr:hypothetical protein DICVIV_08934 [Dictyocaulus viviparus]
MDDAGLNVDEAIVFNTVPLRSRWRPSKYTFNDIAVVLTMDQEVEDGVVHAYMIRSPPWSCLPSPVLSHCRHDLVNFQLLNQPLKMTSTVDDDDERLSLSSTVINSQDLKIQSLEAQLALLSKQMQALLAGKTPPADTVICNFEGSSVSDDEGKGASLGSPIETKKPIIHHEEKEMSKLPNVCPPFSLCPPPPPPLSLMSVQNVVAPEKQASTNRPTALQILGKSEKIEHESLPVRPSVSDLKKVQLRKTNTARSPGGTPLGRYLKQPADEGNYLANALREKFRSVQEYMSEHEEETNTSWLEDDS